jgi:predicted CoA-binding protein
MSNKVVAIVGVLDAYGSTNVFQAKAFLNRGYQVIPVNYRTLMQKYGKRNAQAAIYEIALRQQPALMLFSKCNGLDSVLIGKCGQHTKTWLWFMDGLNTLSHIPEIHSHAQMAEYVSATGRGVCKALNQTRQDTVYQIMEGIDPEFYYPVRPLGDLEADVSFIGSANQERVHYLNLLKENGFNVKAYGSGFDGGEVHGGMFNAVCGSSRVMLALSVEHDTEDYFSDRVFRYGACGSFVLHKHSPSMEKRFVHGEDLWYFKSDEDLIEAVKTALDQPEQRQTMSENLRNKVLSSHTWYHVVDEIIRIAEI